MTAKQHGGAHERVGTPVEYALWIMVFAPILLHCTKKTMHFVAFNCALLHNKPLIFKLSIHKYLFGKGVKSDSGRRGRMFESCHSDQIPEKSPDYSGLFSFLPAFCFIRGGGFSSW